jgi:Sec7-like guanine-nucleotide exchange factor
MPIYEFLDTKTSESFEQIMKISEREVFLLNNPHIQPIISAPMLVSSVSTIGKLPEGFKEVLSKVGEAHPDSKIGREYGNKTNAQVKARDIVEKYRKKAKIA